MCISANWFGLVLLSPDSVGKVVKFISNVLLTFYRKAFLEVPIRKGRQAAVMFLQEQRTQGNLVISPVETGDRIGKQWLLQDTEYIKSSLCSTGGPWLSILHIGVCIC